MKKDGKYRFTLQFGSDSDEQIQAGELLERLGNRKSTIVVDALNEYMASHPELQDTHYKIEVTIASNYNREKIEEVIRRIVEDRIAGLQLTGIKAEISQDESPEAMEDDIAQMLDNLDLFQ